MMHQIVHTLIYFRKRAGKATKSTDENLRWRKVNDIICVSVIWFKTYRAFPR